jgi:hypothetical protein
VATVRGAVRRRDAHPVRDQRLHIAIDVSVAGDQIQGHVREGESTPRQFSGWLGLIGELDGMLCSRRPDHPDTAVAREDNEQGQGGRR